MASSSTSIPRVSPVDDATIQINAEGELEVKTIQTANIEDGAVTYVKTDGVGLLNDSNEVTAEASQALGVGQNASVRSFTYDGSAVKLQTVILTCQARKSTLETDPTIRLVLTDGTNTVTLDETGMGGTSSYQNYTFEGDVTALDEDAEITVSIFVDMNAASGTTTFYTKNINIDLFVSPITNLTDSGNWS